ncbi:sensor histidine kinase [Goodfellowiella coeruleoviolacea]|uniref:histidine kinase n=1 Tax=Goodfellowiella coeruleoviolacea TaxID=334858 RepID=A0AAE3KKB4_9PSEU|nr:histidine kinase [Goodfellowiella coeruleoviolacea]MCP2165248.1 Signal transduction histidine kinase [Goodfellowiella coeruleoviolacea]
MRNTEDQPAGPRRGQRALARQSLVVAVACAATDAGLCLPPADLADWRCWLLLGLVIVADLALALPPRWAREVAVGHGLLVALAPVLLDGLPGPQMINNAGLLVSGYLAGSWLRTWPALTALAGLVLGFAVNAVGDQDFARGWVVLLLMIVGNCLVPWLVGRFTMARRTYIVDLEQHAERLRRDEQVAVQRAVAEERSAIARDLHDVISHHVSTISMHAGAARLGLAEPASPVHRSLAAVEAASRAALADLRRLLDVLHGQDSGAGQRQPGLDNIDELLDGVRGAGLPVRLTVHGAAQPLPGSLDVAAYRVIQEALTNAVRHGDGDTVEIELTHRPGEVCVTVTNGVPVGAGGRGGAEGESSRRGLAGMRQRVALFGGRIGYGPQPDGRRWRVRVSFPVEQT